jgi:uncharacterized protein (TIGR03437 family)
MRYLPLVCAACLLTPFAFTQERESQREIDDHQAERQEWFYQQRAYPLGRIPEGARLKAIEHLRQIDQAARSRRTGLSAAALQPRLTSDPANWSPIGPRPTNQGSTYVTAGRINAIAIDPRDNNTIYIGAAEGGVWKSADGGATWIPLTDDQSSLANGAIVLDPQNPDIIYVGTGEENFAGDSYYGAGILKSTDRGATWTNIVGPFLRARIGSIAIHPSNSQVLLCTTDTGIWRSEDGASNWTRVLGQGGTAAAFVQGTSVSFDPTNGDIAYAALGGPNGNSRNGVYRSSDSGKTWTLINGSGANALPGANVGRIEIAIAPSTPTTLYVGLQNSDPANFGKFLGMWKTTDSGQTWNQLVTAPSNFCASQCWYDMTIHVHPKNADIVYGGGFGVIRSLDGGATWSNLPFIGSNQIELHVDEHFLAYTPDGSTLYIANDGGMWNTTDTTSPGSVNWNNLNDTLAITQFYPGLATNPIDPNIVVGGTQDNGTQLYHGNPSWDNITCGDGGFAAIDPSNPEIIYGACQNISINRISAISAADGVFVPSTYGIDKTDRTQFISPLAIDPSSPQTLYFGTFRLWQSRDGAGRWTPISPDLTGGRTATIKAIAVAPSDSNTVYVGASDGRVQVTRNALAGAGATWTNRSLALPARVVTAITVDPIDAATAYVTFSGFPTDGTGHVYRTRDAGSSWSDVSGDMPNVPVNDISVDADLLDTLYAGTDAGVMISTNAGANWTSLGFGLPKVVVSSLSLQRRARVLRAATHGRSVWEIAVPLASSSAQPLITSVSPTVVNAGDAAFTLTVTGSNFVAGTILRWNGQDRPTTVADGNHLTARIPAADIASVGRADVLAFNPSRGGGASNSLTFAIGPAPASISTAFVSAAFPLGGNALAPRSIASIYGTNLAPAVASADVAPPLPFALSGTRLTLAGNPVPLFFISPGQINFQVPFIPVSGTTQVPLVITQGTFSTTVTVTLRPFAPGLFTTNSQGSGQAATIIASSGVLAAPAGAFPDSRPAKKGEAVSIYCTGLGDVRNRPGLGSPSPAGPLATTIATPLVTIGGARAAILFSGLAPGFVGLYQVNVTVPADAGSGDAVPISLSIGGVTSNTATIAIE